MIAAPWSLCVAVLREAAFWAAAVALHLLAAILAARLILAPRPSLPAPTLVVDSIELEVAEVESEIARPAISRPPTPPAAESPRPEPAPYLTAPDAALPLAAPPAIEPSRPLPPMLDVPPSPPRPDARPDASTLPEISLPPAQPEASPPRLAAGATARIENKPKLLTDLSRLRKSYPPEARRNGWEGTVVLDLVIDAEGRLASASIHTSSGHATLDRAALRMIRSARFAGGPGRLLQPIDYRLR